MKFAPIPPFKGIAEGSAIAEATEVEAVAWVVAFPPEIVRVGFVAVVKTPPAVGALTITPYR